MRDASSLLRLTAVTLITVLCLTLAAPARAEADVMWAIAVAGLVVVAVIVIVYLVVASSRGPKMPVEAQPVMIACVESDVEARSCWPMSGPVSPAAVPTAAVAVPMAPLVPAPMEALPQS